MMPYRFKISSEDALFKTIEKLAPEVDSSIESIKSLSSDLEKIYKRIKDIYPDLSRLNLQKVKLSETPSRLKEVDKRKDYIDINSEFLEKTENLCRQIVAAAYALKKIISNTNTLIYREDKELNRLASGLKKLDDPELSQEILNKINSVKEAMKTTSRRLLESARAQEHELFIRSFEKKPASPSVSEKIKELGMDAGRIDDAIEKLNINSIDEITEKSEKQLLEFKKIELLAKTVIPRLDSTLIDIKNKLYMLSDDTSKKIVSLLDKTGSRLEKSKKQITSQTQDLFERIRILY